ncbi:MAG: T9SS type A sorting domain-containing protein [Schleiferiaceae bacterium]|nr:T9SS type A sorting domain-containing protein [Schleiferiaceae bacterium]
MDSTKFSGINYTDYRLIQLDSGQFGMFGVTRNDLSSAQLHYNVGFSQINPARCRASIDTMPFLGNEDKNSPPMHTLLNDCFTYRNSDSLLFAVTGHSDPFITEDSTAIFFYNYNFKQGRLNWMKKMESPYFVWPHVALEALPDGRYVVGLTEFNPDRYPQYTRSLAGRLMIIDAQGQALDNRDLRPVPQQNWSLFPNPATNSVRIKGLPQRPQKLQYTLYNTLGQAVQKGSFTTDHPHIQLPVPTGLYHLQLRHPQAQLGSRALQVLERR